MAPDPDLYALLGVSRDADAEAIKKAYRRLARQLHPDVNPDPATQEKFKEVSRAYEILSDPQKRAAYDRGGDPFGGAGGGFGQGPGFSFTDIMDAFFGTGSGQRGPRSRARRGRNATIRVDLDLAALVVDDLLEPGPAPDDALCERRPPAAHLALHDPRAPALQVRNAVERGADVAVRWLRRVGEDARVHARGARRPRRARSGGDLRDGIRSHRTKS